ncbi:MAG: NADH-quinone oxidoreductase subunit C [Bacteroidetes bacterium]|nr:NADH-quinone oxidoreductase subunit C [Bacteroidota bacterium]
MTKEELKATITEILPTATFDEAGEWLNVLIDSREWLPLAWQLRSHHPLHFDYLFCVTAVDWKSYLSMVYHLRSTKLEHIIVVKTKIVDRNHPEIETVSQIWRTAEFHEREAYDLFGIKFLHHPDLRRLLLSDDWEGWPLRKDYVDEVNMIKL